VCGEAGEGVVDAVGGVVVAAAILLDLMTDMFTILNVLFLWLFLFSLINSLAVSENERGWMQSKTI